MALRICVILTFCMIFFSARYGFGNQPNGRENDNPDIDEIMSVNLSKIDLALSNPKKTKTARGLMEIERLDKDGCQSLSDWWESVTAPCCIGKGRDLDDLKAAWKEAVEKNEPKLNHYLKAICENETKIADYYVKAKNTKKARLLYKRIITSFDPSSFETCVKGAEESLSLLSVRK